MTIEIIDKGSVYFNPNGFYVVIDDQAIVPLCADCAEAARPDGIPEEWEPLGAGEVDGPTHCDTCGALIVERLTPDGVDYVRGAIAQGAGRAEILEAWREAYANYL